jgi:hypothetical protein
MSKWCCSQTNVNIDVLIISIFFCSKYNKEMKEYKNNVNEGEHGLWVYLFCIHVFTEIIVFLGV